MSSSRSLRWLQRLFSSSASKAGPTACSSCCSAAERARPGSKAGQGRGLVATRELEYGELIFREQPYLCVPAISKRKQVCYHCLKVLQQQGQQQYDTSSSTAGAGGGTRHTRSGAFCSQTCQSAAQASYYALESQVNLTQLENYCEAQGERFPLMAARLALMVAQRAMLPPQPYSLTSDAAADPHGPTIARFSSTSSSTYSGAGALNSSSYMSSGSSTTNATRQGKGMGRLSARSSLDTSSVGAASTVSNTSQQQQQHEDPSAPLAFLCFANVPPPPPAPWVESHKLLMAALREACDCREDPREGQALAAAVDSLSIEWYVAVLARLHLNTFKVDAVLPLDWSDMQAAAAACYADSSTGSSLYLLGSLFNHSCEPSVNITFPGRDGTAVFTAARRISAGEQLHISYTDTEQEVDVRQQYLAFAYGFHCSCPRCSDDVAELKKSSVQVLQPQ